jgi:hypothetical protein
VRALAASSISVRNGEELGLKVAGRRERRCARSVELRGLADLSLDAENDVNAPSDGSGK